MLSVEPRDAAANHVAEHHPIQRRTRIYLLGRYRRDEAYMPRHYDANQVEVEFITIHSSKGLEADHVIIPRVTSETLGLPSKVVDDPVLAVAMPNGEAFEFAEERRLFYVALTRAKQTVTLITIAGKESAFVFELVREHGLKIRDMHGEVSSAQACPECGSGFLVPRSGRFGSFLGCTNYPRCRTTAKLQGRQ
jgi:DNA helicase-4